MSDVAAKGVCRGRNRQCGAVSLASFTIYDDHTNAAVPVVAIELPHARLTLDDPHDVAAYRETFARWRAAALLGREAEQFLRDLAGELA